MARGRLRTLAILAEISDVPDDVKPVAIRLAHGWTGECAELANAARAICA